MIEILEIPHGHGLSFKRGIADGLLDSREHEVNVHETNLASYYRGIEIGTKLKAEVAMKVKK